MYLCACSLLPARARSNAHTKSQVELIAKFSCFAPFLLVRLESGCRCNANHLLCVQSKLEIISIKIASDSIITFESFWKTSWQKLVARLNNQLTKWLSNWATEKLSNWTTERPSDWQTDDKTTNLILTYANCNKGLMANGLHQNKLTSKLWLNTNSFGFIARIMIMII